MFKTHFQASLSDNNRIEKITIRTSQKCAEKIAFWREFGEKNALWGELRREQRGEKIPFKYNRIARIGYAVERINFMRCSYGSANNRPLKKHIPRSDFIRPTV